jgi:hypothetical protein
MSGKTEATEDRRPQSAAPSSFTPIADYAFLSNLPQGGF